MVRLQSILVIVLVLAIVLLAIGCDGQKQQQQQQQQQQQNGKKKVQQQQQLEQQQQSQQKPSKQRVKPQQLQEANNAPTSGINKNKKKKKPQHASEEHNGNGLGDKKKGKFVSKTIHGLGRVRGRVFKSQWSGKNLMQFLDVPYGKSPSGALRFKPPVEVEPWDKILPAYKHHAGCPSLQELERFDEMERKNIDIEDCLRLTVNTKKLSGKSPVMVYIHGDFLYDGNSAEGAPGYLLEEDIVLVSVRYRLGPFGFLSTMTEDMPGNAAVYDVILALKWIQKYIKHFGGDPKSVTLIGQVGGASIINVLTMSPVVPDGLFHRVIYQSGSALSPAFITDNPVPAAQDIARHAGCKNTQKLESVNKCLRKINATALLDAFSLHSIAKATMGVGAYGGVQMVIGGPSGVLPKHPGKMLSSENFKAYPTLGGSVKNPGTFILKDIYIDNFNETIIDEKFDGLGYINFIIQQTNGADPNGVWKSYAQEEIFAADDIKNGSFYRMLPGLIDLCGVISFKNPVLLALQSNAKKLPESTYLYTFDYEGEQNRYATADDDESLMPFELGVSLTDENLYLFPWPRQSLVNSVRDIKIAKRMVALYTSFATTGRPSAVGVPQWPAMVNETGPYLKIGRSVSIGNSFTDEYNIAVKETQMGYNLANEEFFESLVEITDKDSADQSADTNTNQSQYEGDDDEDDEEDDGDDDQDGNNDDDDATNDDDYQQPNHRRSFRATFNRNRYASLYNY